MAIEEISTLHPVPGGTLELRGRGFGNDARVALIEIHSGSGMQLRRKWVHPDVVRDDYLKVTVPPELSGRGRLTVSTPKGRSGAVSIQYDVGDRPVVTQVIMMPSETLINVAAPQGLPDAMELVLNGQVLGSAIQLAPGVYRARGLFELSGYHDVQLASGVAVSPPWRIKGPATPVLVNPGP